MASLKNLAPLLLMSAIGVSQTGCLTLASFLGSKKDVGQIDTRLLEAQGFSIPEGGLPTAVDPADTSIGPHVVLEIREEGRHIERIPFDGDTPVFIQDIVQQANLHEHFGPLKISIMRPNGPAAPPLRLKLHTDKKGKAVSLGRNYALRPGDHIVVSPHVQTGIKQFIEKQLGI